MANYITGAEGQAYADERLNTDAWDDAVEEDGSNMGEPGSLTYKSIAMATSIIDQLNYMGDKTDDDQENQFPRNDDTAVPDDIKRACFEIALALLDDVDPEYETTNAGMISQGYANVRSTYDRLSPAPWTAAGVPSSTAWRYLVKYLRDPYFINMTRTS
jgi:hypothetical protein